LKKRNLVWAHISKHTSLAVDDLLLIRVQAECITILKSIALTFTLLVRNAHRTLKPGQSWTSINDGFQRLSRWPNIHCCWILHVLIIRELTFEHVIWATLQISLLVTLTRLQILFNNFKLDHLSSLGGAINYKKKEKCEHLFFADFSIILVTILLIKSMA